jgi:small redox-active disulfide protein 2
MKIEILGTGCSKCKNLFAVTDEALKESGKSAELIKVESIAEIMKFGVMSTPAIAIDGQVKAAGRVPSKEEIKKWINGITSR